MRRRSWPRAALAAAVLSLLGPPARGQEAPPDPDQERPLAELSLEELMNATVVSASNTREQVGDAPATVIVVTRDEILERGYAEMSELLDDLPGMDVVRPYGATFLKNYWRGFRNTIGDPFLIMVDGVVMNHLYFNTADVMVTFPLSNVLRVEVVYGPASSVYGANAFMGVINVITTAGELPPGASHSVMLSAGSSGERIVDATAGWSHNDLRLSATVRLEDGRLDDHAAEGYEYTRGVYYADRRLWGGFLDNPNLGGSFLSRRRQRALSTRVGLGGAELGLDAFVLDSGYGSEYAADRAQNHAVWARPDLSAWFRLRRDLGPRATSTTLVRWRQSGVSNDSTFLESYTVEDEAGRPVRVADFSYWQSLNSSWSAFEDVEVRAGRRLLLTGGLKYEQKDLQKAYDANYGPALPVDLIQASSYPFPQPPEATPQAPNRITTEDRGIYGQARYRLADGVHANLGLRYDHNSQYGGATDVRAGLVGRRGRWGAKALFGQAFQEPVPRLLYGGWTGSGSDPSLLPERSHTLELSGTFTGKTVRGLMSVYRVRNLDTIVNTAAGAQNLGERTVDGIDLHAQGLVRRGPVQLKLWGYLSQILKADEQDRDDGTARRIGDLARSQIHLGITAALGEHWTASLRARHAGGRDTVASNPVRTVPAYTTVDLALGVDDLLAHGLGLWVRATNAFDATYFQPGVRDASAGDVPGRFVDGAWVGSGGFYSSLLPQPGRALLVTLRLHSD